MHRGIETRNLCAGYGETTVLSGVSIAPSGVFGILGPAGAGKSTLLKAICGDDGGVPEFWWTGSVAIPGGRHVEMLDQKARLYSGTITDFLNAECTAASPEIRRAGASRLLCKAGLSELVPHLHRPVGELSLARHKMLMIARALEADPVCLLLDEPLSGVSMQEESELLAFIQRLRERTTVVFVTHNKQHARSICSEICLVTGGGVAEVTPAGEFFDAPRTDIGREFLRSGSVWPAPVSDHRAPPPVPSSSPPPGTNYFRWTIRDLLGGMAQPGLYGQLGGDLQWLWHLGIRHVVNLTGHPGPGEALRAAGFEVTHFPIADMGVPDLKAAAALCGTLNACIGTGQPVAVHCRAGQGPTGTILASVLVSRGVGPIAAIERVRRSNPRYIETHGQTEFVHEFAEHVAQNTN
jgi:atypical dual specificity phosphatase